MTTQLTELGLPVVVALNMIDLVRKNGDEIDLKKLGEALGCEVVETSALKNEGSMAVSYTHLYATSLTLPIPNSTTCFISHPRLRMMESMHAMPMHHNA